MPNQFESANYPTEEPTLVIAGDRVAWKRQDYGLIYDPDEYQLKYAFRLEGDGSTEIEVTASESGTEYLVEIPSATTAAWTAGRYQWQSYITRTADSERITLDDGSFEVAANSDEATTDPRSANEIALDNIEAVLQGRATKDQESYTIEGRSLSRTPIESLIKLKQYFQAEVNRERREARKRKGLSSGHIIYTRFG